MASESARATSAAEARFRIDHPNSAPRAVKVIALDPASERVVKEIARAAWSRAGFLTAASFNAPRRDESFSGWLSDLAGRATDLVGEIAAADLVVVVAAAGENAQAASVIAEAASLKGVMTTALIVGSAGKPDAALARTLTELRPYAAMIVIASEDEYIADMLAALRA